MRGSSSQTLTALLCLALCWGPWDQDQVQAGTLSKPSIWAEPAAIVLKGTQVTLWCEGSLQATSFRLYKDGNSAPEEVKILKMPSNKTDFSFNFMNEFRAGLYWCSYYRSNIWSERSEPLALVVTGVYDRPSLSAQPGPVVEAGGSVTLSCSSVKISGTFHLLKEGATDPPQQMKSKFSNRKNQAQFPMSPVNSSHGGTYRCYSSYNNNPQVWSQSSEPLHLEVTGGTGAQDSLIHMPTLFGVLAAIVLLLSLLLLLFFFLQRRRQEEHRLPWAADPEPQDSGLHTSAAVTAAAQEETPRAAETEMGPEEEEVELDAQQPSCGEDAQGAVSEQANQAGLSQGVATSPCPLPEMDTDRAGQGDRQAAASTVPQDVTYAQLTLGQGSAPPSSLSEEEPSLYAALAIH